MTTNWREHAACRGEDLAIFFPDGRGPGGGESNPAAEAICSRCPVRRDCLESELEKGIVQFGWFGGVGPEERARIVRKRKRTRGAVA